MTKQEIYNKIEKYNNRENGSFNNNILEKKGWVKHRERVPQTITSAVNTGSWNTKSVA